MKFRTEIETVRSPFTVSHGRFGFVAGSCFSEHIFRRLSEARFPVEANPTGILFNPASIAAMIDRLCMGSAYTEAELRRGADLWFSFDHHSAFSDVSSEAALARINSSFRAGAEALRRADYVIVTFGTAWIYRLSETGAVVANCHKQPDAAFVRERLSADYITELYDALMRGALAGKQVLFTVSPVRHLKDGFAENSLSKAVLRTAVAQIVERFPDQAFYFPSFEIMNDDLRDYRFYAVDMVHPSLQAVDYIWDKFTAFAMDPGTQSLLPKLDRLRTALGHRVMNCGSAASMRFGSASLALIDALERELPEVDFSGEREYFDAMAKGAL